MADVAHSTTSITGGHTNAVAAGAAGFMSGTDKTNLDAAAAVKNGGYTQIAKGTLTLGTGATLSLTDASFTGKTAGGRGDLQGATGVLGIVAGSFASSGAETGTGANQAGLGSAASATQPYNATDFPGQFQYAQCVLLTADRKPITLVQMVAGSITDATAEVYGYLSFRSDLGANAKWRLWFYYRRAADGFEVPFTPTVSLANCWLEVPEIFLASTLAPGFGLSQTTAGPAVSSIPTLDKVPAPVASVAFNSQRATGGADPIAADNFATRNFVDQQIVSVAAVTTVALPAYTYANGTAGVGATMTANANGAFPSLDNQALIANDPVSGPFLHHNGASNADNGVYMLTTQGSGGTAWVATRYTGLDTAAKIPGSKIRVRFGNQSGGGEYIYKATATITMGTTSLFWRRTDANMGPNEGFRYFDDMATSVVPTANTAIPGPGSLQYVAVGTSAAATAAANNSTAGVVGEWTFVTGTTATAEVGVADSTTGTNGGGVLLDANTDIDVEVRFASTTLSVLNQDYVLNIGLAKQLAASQTTPADGILFVYDRLNRGANLFAVCSSGGTPTAVDTGITYTATQRYRGTIIRDAGDANVRFYLDGALVATISTNVPTGPVGLHGMCYKSTGTTSIAALSLDWFKKFIFLPRRRAA